MAERWTPIASTGRAPASVVLKKEPQKALRTCLSIMLCAGLTYGALIWNALLAFHVLSAR
jgi:hypothetical protein